MTPSNWSQAAPEPRVIVDPTGQPARPAADAACPRCGLGADRRVLVSGFGPPKYSCGNCGRDVDEATP
jgi:uncharacterized protein (DUF983 family)